MTSLRVEPLKDADVEESMIIQYYAFRHADGIGRFLSPDPEPSQEHITTSSTSRRKQMRNNPDSYFMSVIDNATNKVVACGHWDIFPDQRTPEQMEDLTSFPPAPASANADAWSDFFENFAERRRTILGTKPAAILCTLTTHPAHHRRGAGAMLMEQFLKNVDDAGLEAYLEASEMGKPLYARFGFAPGISTEFPLDRYGGTGVDRNTVMIRPAKSKGT